MKKITLGIISVVAVVLLSPLLAGFVAKHNLEQYHARVNQVYQSSAFPVKMQLVDYHQGWFSSDAKVKLSSSNEGFQKLITTMKGADTITLKIYHGPVVFALRGQGLVDFALAGVKFVPDYELDNNMQAQLKKVFADQKLYTGYRLIDFSGSSVSHLDSAKIHMNDKQSGLQVDWDGATINGDMTKDLTQSTFDLVVAGVKAKMSPYTIESSPLLIKGRVKLGAHDLWNSSMHLELDSLKVPSLFELSGLEVNSRQLENGADKVDFNFNALVKHATFLGDYVGPATLQINLHAFDSEAVKTINNKFAELASHKDITPQMQAEYGILVMPQVMKMINGANIQVLYNMKSSRGDVDIKLDLSNQASNIGGWFMNPLAMLNNISGTFDLVISKQLALELVAQTSDDPNFSAQKALDAEIAAGNIVIDGENYVSHVVLEKGQLKVNGKIHEVLSPKKAA